jgi:DNA repair photolyase
MALKTLDGADAAPRKGRGAGINPEGRFETAEREAVDDGWSTPEEARPLRTTITIEAAKSIISHNQSPDVGFSQSINPYGGCEHGCCYCMAGDTPVLMGDGSTRALAALRVGDAIFGTRREGWHRRYVRSRVQAHWSVVKPAFRLTLEDGTTLVAGADHRFLTERGWKFVAQSPGAPRPSLTTCDRLMGTGAFARPVPQDTDYRLGYVCGMVRGDAHLATHHRARVGRGHGNVHRFRLALCDRDRLERTQAYLEEFGAGAQGLAFAQAIGNTRALHGMRTASRANVDIIRALIEVPVDPGRSWSAGFLAGIFDAEGSFSRNVLRICNTDPLIIDCTCRCLEALGFRFGVDERKAERPKPVAAVRLNGGLVEHLRFFHVVDPAIRRKVDISGHAVETDARLRVTSIEPVGGMRLYDVTTETGDFIADGVVSHNCFARPSHAYRNLSPGIDFETRIFAKTNAAQLLRKELSRPGYACSVIAIGVNTDAYQPVERELRVTRSILEVCAAFNQPVGLITKNATIERDIDILAPMAARRLASVTISLNNLDHDVARRLEPRCAAPARRLRVIRTLSQAGIPVRVLVAPVIPFITDDQIERVLEAAREHGASKAGYVLLRLPWEVKDIFREWVERHYPLKAKHVMSRVHAMRNGRDNDPCFGSRMTGSGELARLLERRFAIACRRLGFENDREALDTTLFRVPADTPQLPLF